MEPQVASDAPAQRAVATFDAERTMVTVLLAIRTLTLVVALVSVSIGWSRYRSQVLVIAALAVLFVESAWLIVRAVPRKSLADPLAAWVDAGMGLLILFGCGLALFPADRLTSLNWANVVAITTVGPGAAIAHKRLAPGLVTVGILTGTTLALAAVGHHTASDRVSTAIYFLGMFGGARYLQATFRGWARDQEHLDQARRDAERALAVEQERSRQHRLLHDTALQTLEAVGQGLLVDESARSRCRAEAARLRRALQGEDMASAGLLMDRLADLVVEFAERSVQVELTSAGIEGDPGEASILALIGAAREAVMNVHRHAGVSSAVVHVRQRDGGVEVVIRDHGRGFGPDGHRYGFGLPNSIEARMADAGGEATVWSAPGRGTRVTLWAPR